MANNIQPHELLSYARRTHELRVLLGAIACMTLPTANAELTDTIQLACAIADEIRNDMDASSITQ